MRQRQWWPVVVLGVALVAALAWGYNQNRARAQLAIRSENAYQQAFQRLEQAVVNMEESLSTALVARSVPLQRRTLGDLRVFSSTAVESLAGLPFLHVKLERTQKFLNDVSEVSEAGLVQLDRNQPLTPEQKARLRELHQQARFLNGELAKLSGLLASGRIRWADTERMTMASADGGGVTPILQGISGIEAGLRPPPGEETATQPQPGPHEKPKSDLGPRIGQDQALAIAARFADLPPATRPQLSGRADGALPVFLVSYTKTSGVPVTIAVTEQGGHVLQMLDGREVTQIKLGREQVVAKARQFLEKNGFPSLLETEYDEYGDAGGVAVVTFVPIQDGVALFPQRLKVRVARDNGEIVGFDGRDYWVYRRDRTLQRPKITADQAAEHLEPGVTVEDVQLGVVQADRDREVLAYRLRARLDDLRYDIYVDATTGEEVRVDRVDRD